MFDIFWISNSKMVASLIITGVFGYYMEIELAHFILHANMQSFVQMHHCHVFIVIQFIYKVAAFEQII